MCRCNERIPEGIRAPITYGCDDLRQGVDDQLCPVSGEISVVHGNSTLIVMSINNDEGNVKHDEEDVE